MSNKLNVSAQSFNTNRLSELLGKVRRTQRLVTEFGSNFDELRAERAELADKIQSELNANNFAEVTKIGTRIKEIDAKLDATPDEKVKNFNKAVDELASHMASLQATSIKAVEPSGKKAA